MSGKRLLGFSLFILVTAVILQAQDTNSMLNAYMKSFARGSLSTKIQVLQDSAKVNGSDMCPLYSQAARFVKDNYRTLYDDSAAGELSLLTVRLAGIKGCSETAGILWSIFEESDKIQLKTEIISSIGEMGVDSAVIEKLNGWLGGENEKKRQGKTCSEQLVAEMVNTLGKLGSSSSFSVLFSTGALKFSSEITGKAVAALKNLDTDYTGSLISILKNGRIEDKHAVLELLAGDSDMDEESKGKVLTAALEESLKSSDSSSEKEKQLLRELRLGAVKELTPLHWSAAGELAVKSFNVTLEEVESGLITKTRLVEAINFLGSVKIHEAAVRLSAYLEVLNSRKESGQLVNTKVVTAVIDNLSLLGDKTAFDNLLYAGYLDYPASVKQAAREALNNLKSP